MADPMPTAPKPTDHRLHHRPVLLAAVIGGGVCMLAVVIGLTILGLHSEGTNDVAMTGLAAIGSTLAGGFASWLGYNRRGYDHGNGNGRE